MVAASGRSIAGTTLRLIPAFSAARIAASSSVRYVFGGGDITTGTRGVMVLDEGVGLLVDTMSCQFTDALFIHLPRPRVFSVSSIYQIVACIWKFVGHFFRAAVTSIHHRGCLRRAATSKSCQC